MARACDICASAHAVPSVAVAGPGGGPEPRAERPDRRLRSSGSRARARAAVEAAERAEPARVEALAGPVPVDRDDVARPATSSTNPAPSSQPRMRSDARLPRAGAGRPRARAARPRPRASRRRARGPGPSGSGTTSMISRARSISPVRIRPTFGKTSSTWNAWTGTAPASGVVASQRQPSAANARPEARLERRAEVRRPDGVEQRAAEPVGLDDAGVQRIGDAVAARDQLEVRIGALELPGEVAELRAPRALGRLLEQLAGLVGAAVAEPVRAERVAREADRAGGGRDRPGPVARAARRLGRRRSWLGCSGLRAGRATVRRAARRGPRMTRTATRAGQDQALAREAATARAGARDREPERRRDRRAEDEDRRDEARRGPLQRREPGPDVRREQDARSGAPTPTARGEATATVAEPAGHGEEADEHDEADAQPRGADHRRRDVGRTRAWQRSSRPPRGASRRRSSSRPCPRSRRPA